MHDGEVKLLFIRSSTHLGGLEIALPATFDRFKFNFFLIKKI